MNNIFISYRREDSEGFARGLFQSLVGAFGSDRVFMDVEAIRLGTDFVEAIEKSLAGCGALLVLIGKDWVNCTDAAGRRRLDDPRDFVRMEVAKALEHGVTVIPVMIKGAKEPAAENLPDVLQPIARLQSLELRHERWNQDVDHLTSELAKLLGLERLDRLGSVPPPPAPKPAKKLGGRILMGLAAVLGVAILIIAGNLLISKNPTSPDTVQLDPQNQDGSDPAASPAPVSVSPANENHVVVEPKNTAKMKPNPPQAINLNGMWVDDDGVNVQISHQGQEVVSQAYDPLTGLAVNAVWRISGRNVFFNWASNAGNQGTGEGTISADGAIVNYRYVDNVTGERDTGQLKRVTQ